MRSLGMGVLLMPEKWGGEEGARHQGEQVLNPSSASFQLRKSGQGLSGETVSPQGIRGLQESRQVPAPSTRGPQSALP